MKKIDSFAHILPKNYYQEMLKIDKTIPQKFPFINIPALVDLDERIKTWPAKDIKQVLSFANINAEDFTEPNEAAQLAQAGNRELAKIIEKFPDYFESGVGMLALNNVKASCDILEEIAHSSSLVGAQIFTRHLGKSIAAPEYEPIFATAAKLNVPLWLHPVFDVRKPDNNLVFSWEYELSQAMLQLVQANIFEKYPTIKIIIHHAGAMVPFFAGRINHILPQEQAVDFKKFYVDTAILGNAPALKLALDYYGSDHVLFGTDAPFGVKPAGATKIIVDALEELNLPVTKMEDIFYKNYQKLVSGE
ncbi:amidohydrolase family protein [Lactobacillus sp. PV012]|uniref:amidohydrolase family protein n=1 Tax=Lactobacillus sp. PV012 TaxID=2594494 RepID=UPI002240BC95|nr:amidohydrolase family protein [Lactobacillus sp. PV012]QNQ81640.1 amidohydrolase family protein [Lactobacillus sp. PV012]